MLTTLDQIRTFWAKNEIPIYFVSPTPFNLLGMDQWVQHLKYVTYIDTFDGQHPQVVIPKQVTSPVFNHLEEINQYLLSHKSVSELLNQDRRELPKDAPQSQVIFLFFDTELESICSALDLTICLPKFETVKAVDSKITTTQIGNEAGVPSVPNVLAKVTNYKHLCELAKRHDLGDQWVIQTAFGDSGKTTFFISNEADYTKVSAQIEQESCVKIMKKIRCVSTAIEACATNAGTFVGPLMRELIGVPALTPYRGGWCGNDLNPSGFSKDIRRAAMQMTEKLGQALYHRGYRGYFEVDYLLDLETKTVYLGELNPRLSGVTAMTNLSPFAQETLPLFLFHLLEFFKVPFKIDAAAYNQAILTEGAKGTTGQVILKYTDSALKIIASAPVSGVYTLSESGALSLKKKSVNRLDAKAPDEVFLLRIMSTGEYAYPGADLAILCVNIPLMGPKNGLTPSARAWIKRLKAAFRFRALTEDEQSTVERYRNPGAHVKGSDS